MSRCCLTSRQLSLLLLLTAACSLLQAASAQPVWSTCLYGVESEYGYVSWDLSPLSYSTLSYALPNSSTTAFFSPCGVVQQPNCTAAVDPLQPVFCLLTEEEDGSVTVKVLTVLGVYDPNWPDLTRWFAGDFYSGAPEQLWPPATVLSLNTRHAGFSGSTGYTEVIAVFVCNASASSPFISYLKWLPYDWGAYLPMLYVQTPLTCNATVTQPGDSSSSSTAGQGDNGAEAGFASDWSAVEVVMLALIDTAVLVAFCIGVGLLARHLRKSEPAYMQMQTALMQGADTEQSGSAVQQQQPHAPSSRLSGSPVSNFLPRIGGAEVLPMS